jgi:methyl-accepting chemotaxis protein
MVIVITMEKRDFIMSIKQKNYLLAIVNIVLFLMLIVLSFQSANTTQSKFNGLTNNELQIVDLAKKIETSILKLEKLLLTKSIDKEDDLDVQGIDKLAQSINKDIDSLYKKSKVLNSEKFSKTVKNVELRFSTFYKMGKNMPDDFKEDFDDGIDALIGLDAISKKMQTELQVLAKMTNETLLQQIDNVNNNMADSKNMVLIIGIIGALFSLLLSIYIIRNMSNALDKFEGGLLSFFDFLERNTDDAKEIDIYTKDEFGKMAKVVNHSIHSIKAGVEKENDLIKDATNIVERVNSGYLSGRIQVSCDNPTLNELKEEINKMLEAQSKIIKDVLNVLSTYANSDYRASISNSKIEGEMGQLISDVNKLGDTISTMLAESMKHGINLQNDSSKLLSNINALTSSTSQQADALQTTSSAVDNIAENIKQNSDKASTMAHLADVTKESADSGDELAKKTANAMIEINKSTSEINESISVIDQIAFQTNILSLNAAVEAATAGESGKGFAVVAGEVRNLASRSAEAANQIKTIVEKAQSRATEGLKISEDMTEGYQVLNEKVGEVIILIDDVAKASNEQLSAIASINDTISGMRDRTNNNAKFANDTNVIAQDSAKMANILVEDAKSKEFKGKESLV